MEYVSPTGHLLRRLLKRISTVTNNYLWTPAYSLFALVLGQVGIFEHSVFVVQSINVLVVGLVITGVTSKVPVACY